mmetsp:Transcript_47188/g.112116  ORF Transcript_47188/g.112116 Transcript_47188/m.112116 type:complete len:216 (-) Transcript_47188:80-727(-)|eukprot:CAMPEP_0181446982 /NCGR_PEP_ID=MMETSP1110-20121109/26387_1 /TAXON_ID=174948 /ORGANISM="Symbiodinium sp., Strain CCMP421" /LENGTH=215 /DNA_ID=CAMNT_0023571081 /DNA_START=21 /DNA_END=668 /DNA_ORIENTATION=+
MGRQWTITRELSLLFGVGALLAHWPLHNLLQTPQRMEPVEERPGLDEFPGAATWLTYPWEPQFDAACSQIPQEIKDLIRHVGQDEDAREVLFVRIGDEHMTSRDAQLLAQQSLCGLNSVAKSIGWTKPQVQKNMFRMSVMVDCKHLSLRNWLPCARCLVGVIKAIQPFVSPFYDRMAGLIAVVNAPSAAHSAWFMVQPMLAESTKEVVQFVPASS